MSIDSEIAEQPRTVLRAARAARRAAPAVGTALADRPITHVVIAARGTSDNAARYAQYRWGRTLRLPVALATPSLYATDRPPRLDGALVVGVSQSGASPDLVRVLEVAAAQGRPTVAVTNAVDSPLAGAATAVVPLDVGPEEAVAATKTYTGQLVALTVLGGVLAGALGGAGGSDLATDRIGDDVAEVLATDPVTPLLAEVIGTADRIALVGRGTDMATVGEWALKLQELAGVLAHPWSSADFRHGPFALAAQGLPVVVVATDPAHRDEAHQLAEDLDRAGARVGLARAGAPSPDTTAAPGPRVDLPGAGPVAGAVVAAVAAQLATVALTRARGLDPDAPALIRKVTRTR